MQRIESLLFCLDCSGEMPPSQGFFMLRVCILKSVLVQHRRIVSGRPAESCDVGSQRSTRFSATFETVKLFDWSCKKKMANALPRSQIATVSVTFTLPCPQLNRRFQTGSFISEWGRRHGDIFERGILLLMSGACTVQAYVYEMVHKPVTNQVFTEEEQKKQVMVTILMVENIIKCVLTFICIFN